MLRGKEHLNADTLPRRPRPPQMHDLAGLARVGCIGGFFGTDQAHPYLPTKLK